MKLSESDANARLRHEHGRTTITTINSKQVVIKEVSASCSSQEYLRLRREAEVLNKVQADCFPKMITQFENTERSGIIEQFLPGQSLVEWQKSSHTAKKERIQIFMQILDLIEILHQNGFLQMDLRLEDLLIHQGKVYLTSFKDCIPVGSLPSLFDDAMPLPDEASQAEPLGIRADQIVLAAVYEQLVGKSVWLKIARAKHPTHRFSSLMNWKRVVRISCYQKQIAASLSGAVLVILFGWCFLQFDGLKILPGHRTAQRKPELSEIISTTSRFQANSQSEKTQSGMTIPEEHEAAEQTLIFDKEDNPENLCLKIYQEIARNPDQILDVRTWISYTKQTLEQAYLPLAGYLIDHLPADAGSISLEVQVYEFELGVFCRNPDPDLLEGILRKLPGEQDRQELLSSLTGCLRVNQIQADDTKLENVIESLAQDVPLSHELCTNLLNYLLWFQTQQPKIWNIPDAVSNELQVQAPDLYGIWIKTQIP